jgi:uncharacterized protein YndB with AHSA1/START domain
MFFPKDVRVSANVEIAASPELVFSYMTNPEHIRRWQPDVTASLPPPEGGLRVGTRFRTSVKEYGRRFDVELLVTAIEMNEHVAYDMESPVASVQSEFRLVPRGNNTRVEHTAVVKPRAFGRVLLPFVRGFLERKLQSRLILLREAVESAPEARTLSPFARAAPL